MRVYVNMLQSYAEGWVGMENGTGVVFVAAKREDLEPHAAEIKANGEHYRIFPRQVSAGGIPFQVFVLVIIKKGG